jgi:hypothetical protein
LLRSLRLGVVVLVCWPLWTWAQADAAAPQPVGEVLFSRGVGFAQSPGQTPRTLGAGLPLWEGDRLSTASGGSAVFRLSDGTRMSLRPQSELVLDTVRFRQQAEDNSLTLGLLRGGFRAITGLISKGSERAARVNTPTATLGIRGTDFDARICAGDCASDSGTLASGQPASPPRTVQPQASAKVVQVEGVFSATAPAQAPRRLVQGSSVYPGEWLETGPQAQAVLAFRDQSRISLGAGTRFEVRDFAFDAEQPAEGRFLVALLKGTVRVLTGLIAKAQPRNVSFKTPTATIGIRGTGIDLSCESADCRFFTWLGAMTVTPDGQTAVQVLEAGQGLLVTPTGMSPINELPLPGLERPDLVPVDLKALFASTAVDESTQGVYVFVRDGHIELTTPQGERVHLGRGEVGLADNSGRALRPLLLPSFIERDRTPSPSSNSPLLGSVLEAAGLRTETQCRR